jgi:hypothetical protein
MMPMRWVLDALPVTRRNVTTTIDSSIKSILCVLASLPISGDSLSNWYFAEGGKPNGPHSEEDVRRLLLTEQVNADTLFWRDGLQEWSALRTLAEFADVVSRKAPPPIPVAPPPVPQLEAVGAALRPALTPTPTSAPMPEPATEGGPDSWGEPIFVPAAERQQLSSNTPWSRYFARSFDLTITSYIAGFGVGCGLVYVSPDMYRALISQQAQVQSLILLPVAMILNGIVAGLFGTTLGKWIMALRFTYLNGRLGVRGQIGRELGGVWVKGMGFGIPIVSLFTAMSQYRRVTQGLPASYDEGSVLVKQDDISAWRRAIGMIFCAAVFVGGIAWSVWPETPGSSYTSRASLSRAPVRWTNPTSGRAAMLPAGWEASTQDNGEGIMVYVFNYTDQTRQAILGVEDATTDIADVQTYGRALKAGLAGTMTLGDFAPTATPGVLRADGTFDSEGYRTSVLISQVGRRLWRIVNVDTLARSGDVTVPALTSALWSTTN